MSDDERGKYFDEHCICDCPNNLDHHVIAAHPTCPLCHQPWTLREATCPKGLWVYICDNPKCKIVEVVNA